ncbi:MAG: hypothetical protein AB7F49_39235, partial [Pseudorhodoplanes sp.]
MRQVMLFIERTSGLLKSKLDPNNGVTMNVVQRGSIWSHLIKPDRVRSALYNDPEIFELELKNIWYRSWVYVGHESEVSKPHDFVMKSIGPQQVIMTRDG